MTEMYLYDAVRTPRGSGKPDGALSSLMPQELVSQLVGSLRDRTDNALDEHVTGLTLGCVGQVGAQGGHIALVSRLHSSLPDHCRSLSLNNYCVSGLSAVALAAREGQARPSDELYLAGGVEMMSRVPFTGDKAALFEDPAVSETLGYVPVYMSADLLAYENDIPREDLDAVTARSHQRAHAATELDRPELIAIKDAEGTVLLKTDQSIRPGTTLKGLSRFSAAFTELHAGPLGTRLKERSGQPDLTGIHTVAHCPPVTDGAALAVLGSKAAGEAAGLKPRARIVAVEEASGDATRQLTAGFAAVEKVLKSSGLTISDFDQIEFMEAFAATAVKFERDYKPDVERLNPEGGHLAMGHPMGATGAILLSTLLAGLERRDGKLGLVVATGGSGLGCAMIIERC